jgi:hypothetical protein
MRDKPVTPIEIGLMAVVGYVAHSLLFADPAGTRSLMISWSAGLRDFEQS